MALILTLADLYSRVPSKTVRGYFDDAGQGTLNEDSQIVQDVLMAAEGEFFSRALRSWPGGAENAQSSLVKMIENDPTLKMHLSWVACELASERRPEFTDAQGFGAHRAQYDRAIAYFENIAKGILRSRAESITGPGANTGSPSFPVDEVPGNFVFAPSKGSPFGHGGF